MAGMSGGFHASGEDAGGGTSSGGGAAAVHRHPWHTCLPLDDGQGDLQRWQAATERWDQTPLQAAVLGPPSVGGSTSPSPR